MAGGALKNSIFHDLLSLTSPAVKASALRGTSIQCALTPLISCQLVQMNQLFA